MRYGDDFVLFVRSRSEAEIAKLQVTEWLAYELKLTVHQKNNVIIKAGQGLRFLGHSIFTRSQITTDKEITIKITNNLNIQNISSYKAMRLTYRQSKLLTWLILKSLH